MPSRRDALRSIAAASAVGLTGCTGRLPALFGDPGRDESLIPVAWERWLHGAQFGQQRDAEPLVVNLGGARSPPDRRRHAFLGLDRGTGEQVWAVDENHELADVTSSDLTVSGPVVVDGRVYTVTDFGAICALDAATGTLAWTAENVISPTGTEEDSLPRETPVTFGDLVCIDGQPEDEDGDVTSVFAFDAADGTRRWRYDLPGTAASTPAAGTSTLVVQLTDGSIVAIGPDGERQWRTSVDDSITGCTVGNGTVFVGGVDETLYAIDLADGTERWRTGFGIAATTAPTLVDDAVVVCGADGSFAASSVTDGDVRWRRTLDNAPTKVAVGSDRLVTLTGTNGLALEPAVDVPETPVTLSAHDRDSGVVLNDFAYDDGRRGWLQDVASDGERFYLARREAVSRLGTAFLKR